MVHPFSWSPSVPAWRLNLGFAEMAVDASRGWWENGGQEADPPLALPWVGSRGPQHTPSGLLTPQGGRGR